jgi:ATP-dependent Clp protease ATP-binding subunit ClpA
MSPEIARLIQYLLALRIGLAGVGTSSSGPVAHPQATPGCEVDTVYMRFRGISVPFAEETRRAAMRSRSLSQAANRDDIRPAYMLAGILSEEDNGATRALVRSGVNVPTLLRQLRAVPGPHAPAGSGPDLPYSRNAVAVLSYAMRHAHSRGDSAVTTLSVLSGIAQCLVDPAARLLRRVHVDSLAIERMIARQEKRGG